MFRNHQDDLEKAYKILLETNDIMIKTETRNLEVLEKTIARNKRYREKIESLEKTIKTQQSTWQKKFNIATNKYLSIAEKYNKAVDKAIELGDKNCQNCRQWHSKEFCMLLDAGDIKGCGLWERRDA